MRQFRIFTLAVVAVLSVSILASRVVAAEGSGGMMNHADGWMGGWTGSGTGGGMWLWPVIGVVVIVLLVVVVINQSKK